MKQTFKPINNNRWHQLRSQIEWQLRYQLNNQLGDLLWYQLCIQIKGVMRDETEV